MPKGYSTFLDLLRLAAALAVFLGHASFRQFTHGGVRMPDQLPHEAVMVFFVLSGYVICYVAHERERRPADYLISRAARIYSVAVPALIITLAVDLWLLRTGGDLQFVRHYQIIEIWKYLPMFLTFTTDIWFFDENAFSNVPYWSLCYEVWYYLTFAALFFLRGRSRLAALAAVAAITGPRLWLLFPVWLSGAGVYMLHRRGTAGVGASRLLFGVSLIGLAAFWGSGLDARLDHAADTLSGRWMVAHLRYSQFFLGDWLSASLLALNFYAARSAGLRFGAVAAPISWAAGFSFTLYLVHFPLLEFLGSFGLSTLPLIGGVLLGAVVIGLGTEHQKGQIRFMLRRWVLRVA